MFVPSVAAIHGFPVSNHATPTVIHGSPVSIHATLAVGTVEHPKSEDYHLSKSHHPFDWNDHHPFNWNDHHPFDWKDHHPFHSKQSNILDRFICNNLLWDRECRQGILLGQRVSEQGIVVDLDKVTTILALKVPGSV